MAETSADILERFRPYNIDLGLRQPYFDLLERLGSPHRHLPPVVHVAGTNGKGSTCAFLRAMVEAAGYKAHVYTSPHLVRFHERIRIAGALIGEDELVAILRDCERLAEPGAVTFFEATTAAAFVAFARHPADLVILEVGLGGRLDATNVIPTAAASAITRLSYDHCAYLGDTLTSIAREKAGIMKKGVPCFAAPQPAPEALNALREVAAERNAPLVVGGEDWRVERLDDTRFRFTGPARSVDLPHPALVGQHQFWNAGLAIATTAAVPLAISDDALRLAMRRVEWPARLQRLDRGVLPSLLPPGWELWLDGGHNDSAGEVLAAQAAAWQREDGDSPRPLHMIFGMLSTKAPKDFLKPLAPFVDRLRTVGIEGEPLACPADDLARLAQQAGFPKATAAADAASALRDIVAAAPRPGRLLICGSLYLAGQILSLNQSGL